MTDYGSVGQSFTIDTREIRALARKYGARAEPMLMNELTISFAEAAKIARHAANILIKGGEDSNLAKAAKTSVQVRGKSITALVDWDGARSETGFPYAASVDRGRKAFGPVQAKVLRFVIDGQTIFAARVKAAPAQNFTGRGKENAIPGIMGTINAGIARWAVKIEAAA